jgi:hypothetical protein
MELNPHQIYERYKEASEDYLKTKVRSQIPPLFSYALLSLIKGISSVDCGCGAQKFLPMPFLLCETCMFIPYLCTCWTG